MDRSLIHSEAFLSLKGVSPQVLMLFLSKRRFEKQGRKGKERWVCTNLSEIEFTYMEAAKKYGISNPRFTRAIDDLVRKGFLEIVHQGGGYRHDKTVYALSDRWEKYGTGDFQQCERPRDPVQRGYRKSKRNKADFDLTHGSIGLHTHANEAK